MEGWLSIEIDPLGGSVDWTHHQDIVIDCNRNFQIFVSQEI